MGKAYPIMAFPDNRLSTTLLAAAYVTPYDLIPPNKTTAYAIGGVGLNDSSQGLNVQLWTATVVGDEVKLVAPNQTVAITVFSAPDITALTIAFDQNMRVTLCYVQYGVAKLYWYDTNIAGYAITEFPGAITPRVTLDDRRDLESSTSDIVLAYVKNDNLYFRLQRERYLTERLLKANVQATLTQMGMNVVNRLQFKLKPYRV